MAVTLAQLHVMKPGTVLQKGKRKRIYLGMEGIMVFYKRPSSKQLHGEHIGYFRKWLLNAEILPDQDMSKPDTKIPL
ncbi:hypothetical protein TCA2_4426 [Paenibacillus sp. TCA20]|uniref:hypothetical protein n=1 Tax=Paenibacillus sp. TCA20 TaxID=1499968 RepID=UPI0004D44E4D|nr:hypothetical protein [Paenibacillus sp. TCA20]GAK41934.1 hypothetical protein TCA2_4426 [Paenibacillus sp. TCA20]